MPLTNAERQQRYRDRQLRVNETEYKERCAERSRQYKASLSEAERRRSNKRKAASMRELRKRRRDELINSKDEDESPAPKRAYKTTAAKSKALNRVTNLMPRSPTKQKELVFDMATRLNMKIRKDNDSKKPSAACIDQKWKDLAVAFMESDSASRATPGRREFIKEKLSNGTKEEKQLRYLISNMKETYALFKEDHPEAEIGYRSFTNLRPRWIRFASQARHNACLCVHHENFEFLLSVLHSKEPLVPTCSKQFIHSVVCDTNSEKCMLGSCEDCPGVQSAAWYDDVVNSDKVVTLKQWKTIKKNNGQKIFALTVEDKSVAECLRLLNEEKLDKFKAHVFTQKKQVEAFRQARGSVPAKHAVLQVDFAENYSCQVQDAVQSAYFSQVSVTIFTAVYWFGDSTVSNVIVSDDKTHSTNSVYVFMKKLLNQIKNECPDLESVHIWSDGCGSQFKNRFTFTNMTFLQQELGVDLDWNFFATSHGKGCVDAVGGTVKRIVWNGVRSRYPGCNVDSAYGFYQAACKLTNVRMMYVNSLEIEAVLGADDVAARLAGVIAVKKTHDKHYARPVNLYALETREYTLQPFSEIHFLKTGALMAVEPLNVLEEMNVSAVAAVVDENDPHQPAPTIDGDEDVLNVFVDENSEYLTQIDAYLNDRQAEADRDNILTKATSYDNQTLSGLSAGSFCVVRYDSARKLRQYVGQVVNYDSNRQIVSMQFYRRVFSSSGQSANTATLRRGDTDDVSVLQIIRLLKIREKNKRQVVFTEALDDITE